MFSVRRLGRRNAGSHRLQSVSCRNNHPCLFCDLLKQQFQMKTKFELTNIHCTYVFAPESWLWVFGEGSFCAVVSWKGTEAMDSLRQSQQGLWEATLQSLKHPKNSFLLFVRCLVSSRVDLDRYLGIFSNCWCFYRRVSLAHGIFVDEFWSRCVQRTVQKLYRNVHRGVMQIIFASIWYFVRFFFINGSFSCNLIFSIINIFSILNQGFGPCTGFYVGPR